MSRARRCSSSLRQARARRAAAERDLRLAAYEPAMRAALDRAGRAAGAERHWTAQVRAALRTLLDELARRPELAGACAAVEALPCENCARVGREPVLEALGALLCPERPGRAVAGSTALADGVLQTIGATVRESSPAALPGLLGQLHWWAVAAGWE